MKRLGIALSAVLLCALLGAQEAPASPAPKAARPLFSTSAAVTEPGIVELEFGAQQIVYKDGCKGRFLPTQFNVGVTPWFDLRLGWSGPSKLWDAGNNDASGGGDPVFGGQAQFLRQATAGLDLGFAHWHKLPRASVSKGIGTGKHDDTFLLTASRTQGRWALDLNAGANWIGRCEGEGRVRQAAGSLAITCALAEGWNATLDTYALARTELGPFVLSSILALSRDLGKDLCVDLGVEVGHTAGAPRYALNAGLVWRLGRIWP